MKRLISEFSPNPNCNIIFFDDKEEFMKLVGEGDYLVDNEGVSWSFDEHCVFVLKK